MQALLLAKATAAKATAICPCAVRFQTRSNASIMPRCCLFPDTERLQFRPLTQLIPSISLPSLSRTAFMLQGC